MEKYLSFPPTLDTRSQSQTNQKEGVSKLKFNEDELLICNLTTLICNKNSPIIIRKWSLIGLFYVYLLQSVTFPGVQFSFDTPSCIII